MAMLVNCSFDGSETQNVIACSHKASGLAKVNSRLVTESGYHSLRSLLLAASLDEESSSGFKKKLATASQAADGIVDDLLP